MLYGETSVFENPQDRLHVKPSRQFSEAAQIAKWNEQKEARRKAFSEAMTLRSQTPVMLSDGIFGKVEQTDQLSFVNVNAITHFEPDTIYILNNNDIARADVRKYAKMFAKQPRACVCIWDFDNHHQIDSSLNFAVLSDYYVPCHPHNNATYQQVCTAMGSPVSAGVVQWSRAELIAHRDRLIDVARDPAPLGRHILYPQFPERNAILEKLNTSFQHVGPSARTYHNRTELDRLEEWTAHMSHWIVPTREDLPIRVFDALITGGLPILPAALKELPALAPLQEHLFYYEPADVDAPHAIAEAAADQFLSQGQAGVIARHELAMATSHVDVRVQDILAQLYRHLHPVT